MGLGLRAGIGAGKAVMAAGEEMGLQPNPISGRGEINPSVLGPRAKQYIQQLRNPAQGQNQQPIQNQVSQPTSPDEQYPFYIPKRKKTVVKR
jgi:hypothetical protein